MMAVFRGSPLTLVAQVGSVALAAVFLGAVFATSSASAQADVAPPKTSASAGKGGQGSKKTTVNFEDQLIEGQAQKPELFYLLQQRNANFKRLIKLRENFLPEMRKTSEEISRKGSGN